MSKDLYIISNKNKNIFSIDNASVILEDGIRNANFLGLDNLFIDIDISSDLKRTILQKAKLNIKEYIFKKDDVSILAFSKAIIDSNSKYTQTEKGYVGEDVISNATLEVEEVARCAYENCNHKLINIDYSSSLLSSNIYRKVINNINEDYPDVELVNLNVEDMSNLDLKDNTTIVLDAIIAPIIVDYILKQGFSLSTVYTCPGWLKASLIKIK